MKMYWIITILAVWLSIGFGFILGATWCGHFVRIERQNGIEA